MDKECFEFLYPVMDIVKGTVVDGPGFRTAIYFAGCFHECKGCHNPESHRIENARFLYTLEELLTIIKEEGFDVTLSGGDPLYHPHTIIPLISEIKKQGKNVWIYTGFKWEEILDNPILYASIKDADIIVDGKFDESRKRENLRFRGSDNQRFIDVQNSLKNNETITIDY